MIINSLLDTDLYKFTMFQSALHQFNTTHVKYKFKCRNKADWTEAMLEHINKEVDHYCTLKFKEGELGYLSSFSFFKQDFIDFLRLYQPNRNHIKIWLDSNWELQIEVEGPWYLTVMFEVPVLAIVNEVYFGFHSCLMGTEEVNSGYTRLEEKYAYAKEHGIPFADFGTRRRYGREWQEFVISTFSKLPNFQGTSNVYFAKLYNLKPIGTMAHEYIMVGAGQDDIRLVKSQSYMLQKWADEYRGDLGIALSDTYGMDAFLVDFDLYFAKLFDGLRHDSGTPEVWADKAIAHYKKLGIDPKTKTLIFSDSLTMQKCADLYYAFKDQAKLSFGIGTHLTNDFENITPLQIVMKIVKCNGRPVAKLSDSKGKLMCEDADYVKYVKQVFKIKD
jgi:nicotinate phosphoribosyltransferase